MPQKSVLAATFSEVLANLAFLFTADEPAEAAPAGNWMETGIRYRGPQSGQIELRCTAEFGTLLAANLLGLEVDDPHALSGAGDAIKELLNVLSGQLLTTLYGAEAVFDLGIPEIRPLPAPPSAAPESDAETAVLFVEGHAIHLLHRREVAVAAGGAT